MMKLTWSKIVAFVKGYPVQFTLGGALLLYGLYRVTIPGAWISNVYYALIYTPPFPGLRISTLLAVFYGLIVVPMLWKANNCAWADYKSLWRNWKFQLLLTTLIATAVIIFIIYASRHHLLGELPDSNKPFYIRNIAVVFAALATAIFTWWKNTLSNRTNEIQEQARQVQEKARQIQEDTRLDELFTKAVELLKQSNDLNTRKAGVYILKDLAMTSPKHAQKCIDMLCALNETWMPKFLKDYPDFFIVNENFPNIKNLEELKLNKNSEADENYLCKNEEVKSYQNIVALSQVVLQTLADIIRHISATDSYTGTYNLDYKFLCSIDLNSVSFAKFSLYSSNLQSADLRGANLQSADLRGANLQFAVLWEANLQSAVLWEADLQSADLSVANLQYADLSVANLQYAVLMGANLQSADLRGANLQSADLREANLQSADLSGTNLQSARLKGANLQSADLSDADLQSAYLIQANLQSARLSGANLQYAVLWKADFRNTDIKRGDITIAIDMEKAYYDGDIIDEKTGKIIKKAGEPDAPNEEGKEDEANN